MVETVPRRELSERDKQRAAQKDLFPIQAIDYLELYVGNALQAAHYYRLVWGYDIIGYRGPETGQRDRVSYVLEQGRVRLVLTAPLNSTSELAEQCPRHGDGVKDIALRVPNVEQAYHVPSAAGPRACRSRRCSPTTTARSSAPPSPPMATPSTACRARLPGTFMPGFQPRRPQRPQRRPRVVDHIVGNVELGTMDEWVELLRQRDGLQQARPLRRQAHHHRILGADVEGHAGRHRQDQVPHQRAGARAKKSQIQEYLDYYGGPGVQHIAMSTGDIIETVQHLRVQRRRVHSSACTPITKTGSASARSTSRSRNSPTLGILVDRDDDGYLLQIFTQAGAGPADAVLRSHRASRLRAASARATSRRCSRPSSASKRCAATCRRFCHAVLSRAGQGAAQAAHAVPQAPTAGCIPRNSSATRASPASSRCSTTTTRRARQPDHALPAATCRRSGASRSSATTTCAPRPPSRAATPSPGARVLMFNDDCRSPSPAPDRSRWTTTITKTARPTSYLHPRGRRAPSRPCMARCPTTKATMC